MDALEQEFKFAASGSVARPDGRDKVLEPLGRTGRRAEWIALVCASLGVGRRGDRARRSGERTRVSTSRGPTWRAVPERPRLRRSGLSDAANAGEPAYPPWPHFACPPEGLAGGCAPSDPRNGNGAP